MPLIGESAGLEAAMIGATGDRDRRGVRRQCSPDPDRETRRAQIKLTKKGYSDWERKIAVEAGETLEIDAELESK